MECLTPISFAAIRLSDAIAHAWLRPKEDGNDAPVVKTASNATSPATTALSGIFSCYIGYLNTKKDALLLIEGYLRGDLPSLRDPQYTASTVRDGSVFIWAQDALAFQSWQDGLLWNPSEPDGEFWISSHGIMGDGLLRKSLSVLALGRCYQIESYENPWKVVDGTLEWPSEDSNFQSITPRDERTSQLTAESQATMDYRYPRAILKVSKIPIMTRKSL